MRAHPRERVRLVLMSATFDKDRYRQYFADVPGCEAVDTVALESAEGVGAWHEQVSTLYLEETVALLPRAERDSHAPLLRAMRLNPDAELGGGGSGGGEVRSSALSEALLSLVRDLVCLLDESEAPQKVILIFCPTYRTLEQCYNRLRSLAAASTAHALAVDALHSSVDVGECLRSMAASVRAGKRKVLLASSIADSSVTIPNVSCVIDLCRSLRVEWSLPRRDFVAKQVRARAFASACERGCERVRACERACVRACVRARA